MEHSLQSFRNLVAVVCVGISIVRLQPGLREESGPLTGLQEAANVPVAVPLLTCCFVHCNPNRVLEYAYLCGFLSYSAIIQYDYSTKNNEFLQVMQGKNKWCAQ